MVVIAKKQPATSPAVSTPEPSTLISSHATSVCLLSAAFYVLVLGYAWGSRFDERRQALCGSAPPFAAWTHEVHLVVVGGSVGTLGIHLFKLLHTLTLHSERHATANAMFAVFFIMALSSTSQTISLAGVFPLCEDIFGFRSPAILWVEWQISVPLLFFLCIALDANKTGLDWQDLFIIVNAALSIGGSLVTNFNIGLWPSVATLVLSNLSMFLSIGFNFYSAFVRYKAASSIEGNSPMDFIAARVAYRRLTCSGFMMGFFPLFPLVYFLVIGRAIDPDTGFSCTLVLNFFAKSIFAEIVLDEHLDAMDPNVFHLLTEKRANESRRAFLRYVFHEVRVPLNSITMGLHLLSDNESIDEPCRETVSMMKEASAYMSETLNDVLSIQKIEDGKLELQFDNFLIKQVLQTVSNSLKGQIDAKGIVLLTSIKHNVPKEVVGDRYRIEHVLANFLSNAIKFSPEYSTIKITVSYGDRVKGCVTFTVADQGEGIPPDMISKLFNDYMQINPGAMQQGKGTGVGLSICKEIVQLHGGKVGCVSKLRVGDDIESGGSKFFFSIPFTIIEDDTEEDQGEDTAEDAERTRLLRVKDREFKVLIVDDVSSNRKMLNMVLSKKGLQCETAGDGQSAIAAVENRPLDHFDFIFMDSRMPKMSGLATTQRLREMGFKQIVVGFTGNAMEEDIDEFLAAGADLVLPKPLKMAHLDSLLLYCHAHGSQSTLTGAEGRLERRRLSNLLGIDKS